jgi:hypothetical protein
MATSWPFGEVSASELTSKDDTDNIHLPEDKRSELHDCLIPLWQVQGVVLDPSCSGSGTVVSRMDHLLPKPATTTTTTAAEATAAEPLEAGAAAGSARATAEDTTGRNGGTKREKVAKRGRAQETAGGGDAVVAGSAVAAAGGSRNSMDEDTWQRVDKLAKFQVGHEEFAWTRQ